MNAVGDGASVTDKAEESPGFQGDGGRRCRILVLSHSHPAFSRGGAEIAAYDLFEGLHRRPDVEAWFLGGCTTNSGRRLGAAITQPFSDREFVYTTCDFEWFNFANRDQAFGREFPRLLAKLRPDVVHFHHFAIFGVEAIYHVRRTIPQARIVLTFHEFLAICHHLGQMIKTSHDSLCFEASRRDCNLCFPNFSQTDFFLRKLYISRHLELIDRFITPGHFLAERLIAWGVDEQRLDVVENLISPPTVVPRPPSADPWRPLRVGFFGQISRLKGINVVLDCASLLRQNNVSDIIFDIHGDYRGQPQKFQEEFMSKLSGIGPNVSFHGPYDRRQVDLLMQSVDLVLVPSIWWENSPLVIQEAFRNRRPVICSNIGGMAEKVRDGKDGWHFPVGEAMSLMRLLERIREQRDLIQEVVGTMRQAPSVDDVIDAHARIYFGAADRSRFDRTRRGECASTHHAEPDGFGEAQRFS